jgi:hypothetical protein
MKTCGPMGVFFCEYLNFSLEREREREERERERKVSGHPHTSASLPSIYKRYKLNYMLKVLRIEGRRREVHTEFWWGNMNERQHL